MASGGAGPAAQSIQLNPVDERDADYLVTMSLSWDFYDLEEAEEVAGWARHELDVVARKFARKWAAR